MKAESENKAKTSAWWQNGYAWLAFGGPAVVVVASIVTGYIAIKDKDPLLDADYYQKGLDFNKTHAAEMEAKTAAEKNSLEPAMVARNHAATGVHQER